MVKSYESVTRFKRYIYLWRLYYLVNRLLKRQVTKGDCYNIDFTPLPIDNRKVMVVTIAFNNDAVLRHQITHMRENWQDNDIEYIVADNSPTIERQNAIRGVCEELNVSYINIPKSELPQGIKEGDVLNCINDKWCIDDKTTKERKDKIKNKLNSLFVD